LYICVLGPVVQTQDPDALYAQRENLASARQAADIWAARLAQHPDDVEAAWKLSRVCYWLGGHAPAADRRRFLDQGIDAGRRAATLSPSRPEGHFWFAANMGAVAESYGIRAGLKYRTPIREQLEQVLRIDPAFMEGSADRALGRWYDRVPGWLGGSNKRAEEHLRASLRYNEQSTITHYFLADLYLDEGRTADARAELTRVLDVPLSAQWAPEDREFKARARQALAKLQERGHA
jgi:tetratricopeptide (TPR) repeat protein